MNAEDRPHASGALAEDVVGLDGRKPRDVGPQYLDLLSREEVRKEQESVAIELRQLVVGQSHRASLT